MKRFNLTAKVAGNAVIFGVENSHLVMFHDVRRWDNDARAKLCIKSGRTKRYATDLGACLDAEPTHDFIHNAVMTALQLPPVFDEAKPSPQPEEKPSPQPETQPRFVAPKKPEAKPATDGSAIGALGVLFGGIKEEVKTEVLQILEPYINSIQRVKHEIKLPDGKKYETTEVLHDKFDDILKLVSAGYNVYLYGDAGTGKSQIAQQIAKAMNLPYYQQDKVEHIHEFIGYVDAHGNFHDTPLFRAWTGGGIINNDEFDGYIPEATLKLNGGLSQGIIVFGDGKAYEKHPDCHVIATGNTNCQGATEEYSTRFPQDASTLNRFVPVDIDYCKDIEKACARNDVELLDFVRQLRNVKKTKDISMVVSYRDIKHLYELDKLFDTEKAIKYCICNRLDEDTARIVLRALPDYDGKWFKTAKKMAEKI